MKKRSTTRSLVLALIPRGASIAPEGGHFVQNPNRIQGTPWFRSMLVSQPTGEVQTSVKFITSPSALSRWERVAEGREAVKKLGWAGDPNSVGTRCSASVLGLPSRTSQQRVPTIELFHSFRVRGQEPTELRIPRRYEVARYILENIDRQIAFALKLFILR